MISTFLVVQDQCLACNNEVLKKLGKLQGVFEASIDWIEGRITVNHTEEVTRTGIAEMLVSLGLPERIEKPGKDGIQPAEASIWGCAL